MTIVNEYRRRDSETELQFIWRLHYYVDKGEMTWEELAGIVNKEFRESEELYRTESAYRKPVQNAERYYKEVFAKMSGDEYSAGIEKQRRELEQEKIRYRDERRGWNQQNYIISREKQTLDILEEAIRDIGRVNFKPRAGGAIALSDTSMLVCLSDLHTGQTFSGYGGRYDSDTEKRRLDLYLEKIISLQLEKGCKNCYIALLGDLISGGIHFTLKVSDRENVINQIKISIEYISSFCYELSKYFDNIYIQGVSGNHSRIIPKKDNAVHDERLDDLIEWAVLLSLSHIPNIHPAGQKLDTGVADIDIYGRKYILVHGDYDEFSKNGIAKLSMFLGFIPYAVLMGHKHSCAYMEESGVKLIQSGCLSGTGDGYTTEKRMKGGASQMICVCSDKGVESLYPVSLS